MNKIFNLVLLSMLLGVGAISSAKEEHAESQIAEKDLDEYVDFLRREAHKQAKLAGFDEELMDILTAVLNGTPFRSIVKELMNNSEYLAVIKEYGVDKEAADRDPRMIAARSRFNEGISILVRIEKMNRSVEKMGRSLGN